LPGRKTFLLCVKKEPQHILGQLAGAVTSAQKITVTSKACVVVPQGNVRSLQKKRKERKTYRLVQQQKSGRQYGNAEDSHNNEFRHRKNTFDPSGDAVF